MHNSAHSPLIKHAILFLVQSVLSSFKHELILVVKFRGQKFKHLVIIFNRKLYWYDDVLIQGFDLICLILLIGNVLSRYYLQICLTNFSNKFSRRRWTILGDLDSFKQPVPRNANLRIRVHGHKLHEICVGLIALHLGLWNSKNHFFRQKTSKRCESNERVCTRFLADAALGSRVQAAAFRGGRTSVLV
jgi:hypothetical protein